MRGSDIMQGIAAFRGMSDALKGDPQKDMYAYMLKRRKLVDDCYSKAMQAGAAGLPPPDCGIATGLGGAAGGGTGYGAAGPTASPMGGGSADDGGTTETYHSGGRVGHYDGGGKVSESEDAARANALADAISIDQARRDFGANNTWIRNRAGTANPEPRVGPLIYATPKYASGGKVEIPHFQGGGTMPAVQTAVGPQPGDPLYEFMSQLPTPEEVVDPSGELMQRGTEDRARIDEAMANLPVHEEPGSLKAPVGGYGPDVPTNQPIGQAEQTAIRTGQPPPKATSRARDFLERRDDDAEAAAGAREKVGDWREIMRKRKEERAAANKERVPLENILTTKTPEERADENARRQELDRVLNSTLPPNVVYPIQPGELGETGGLRGALGLPPEKPSPPPSVAGSTNLPAIPKPGVVPPSGQGAVAPGAAAAGSPAVPAAPAPTAAAPTPPPGAVPPAAVPPNAGRPDTRGLIGANQPPPVGIDKFIQNPVEQVLGSGAAGGTPYIPSPLVRDVMAGRPAPGSTPAVNTSPAATSTATPVTTTGVAPAASAAAGTSTPGGLGAAPAPAPVPGSLGDQRRTAAFDPTKEQGAGVVDASGRVIPPTSQAAVGPTSPQGAQTGDLGGAQNKGLSTNNAVNDFQNSVGGAHSHAVNLVKSGQATPQQIQQGYGAASPRATNAILQRYNGNGRLTPGEAMVAGMTYVYQKALEMGDVQKANAMSFAIVQRANLEASTNGQAAYAAAQRGDMDTAQKYLVRGADWLTDGVTLTKDPKTGQLMAHDIHGNTQPVPIRTGADVMRAALGLSDGSMMWNFINQHAQMVQKGSDKDAVGRNLRNQKTMLEIDRLRMRNAAGVGGGRRGAAPATGGFLAGLDQILNPGRAPPPPPQQVNVTVDREEP
jgi:hypothetical protein